MKSTRSYFISNFTSLEKMLLVWPPDMKPFYINGPKGGRSSYTASNIKLPQSIYKSIRKH
jgi:hypothetical protein